MAYKQKQAKAKKIDVTILPTTHPIWTPRPHKLSQPYLKGWSAKGFDIFIWKRHPFKKGLFSVEYTITIENPNNETIYNKSFSSLKKVEEEAKRLRQNLFQKLIKE
jgi:hypothetical protein